MTRTGRAHPAAARIRDKSVAIIGVGGLGAIAAQELATAGVGRLLLFDGDRVDLTNLHRQLLYGESDIGRLKVDAAAEHLNRVAPECEIRPHALVITQANALRELGTADVVIDGTDRYSAKFWINDCVVRTKTAFVHGGAMGLRGQVLAVRPGRTACLRCIFPESPNETDEAACAAAGVLGPIANLIGALQAVEALHLLADDPRLPPRLITYDGERNRWHALAVARSPNCSACGDG